MPPTRSRDRFIDPDYEGPGEHDQHLIDEDRGSVDLSPCPTCGRAVNAHSRDCHNCGAHFGCEAWQAQGRPKHKLWVGVALALLAGMGYLLVTYGTVF